MILLGRDTPELPLNFFFAEIEIAAFGGFAQDRGLGQPDNLGRAVLTLAMAGAHLNFRRERDAHPGHNVVWEGYTPLVTIKRLVERARRLNGRSQLDQKMSSP